MVVPFFSVIIPTHNRADQLQRAVKSVLEQTVTDFELIIVDDGSTDNTRQVVESFHDKRIHYFYKENEERSIARNYGIKVATGKYIAFLDSDDIYYSNHLQKGLHIIQSSATPAIVITGFEIVQDENQIVLFRSSYDEHINKSIIFDNLLVLNTAFIQRKILDADLLFIEHPDAILSEDWCFFLRLAARFRIYYDNTITCRVTEHESRSLNRLEAENVAVAIQLVIDRLATDPMILKFYSEFNLFKANQYCFIGLHYGIEGKKKRAFRYCIKAMSCYFPVIFRRRFLAVLKKIILPGF